MLPEELFGPANAVRLIYDGDCPVCSAYSRAVRLKRDFGALGLIDARSRPDLVQAFAEHGMDLDQGFVCVVGRQVYHGPEAIHVLSLLSSPVGAFNRLNQAIFRSRAASRLLYPVLKGARNLLLRLRGKQLLHRH